MTESDASTEFTDAFGILNNPTRLTIIEELARNRADAPRDPALTFAELRERVGESDSGTFNYHLDQLRDVFVRKETNGYVLSPEGQRFAGIVAAGGMAGASEEYPRELEETCPVCSGRLTLDYRDGVFGVTCPDDHQFRNRVPRSVVRGRSIEAAIDRFTKYSWQQLEFARECVCPACFNELDAHVFELDESYDVRIGFEGVCDRCGEFVHVPVGLIVAHHPAVLALYLPDDPEYQQRPFWQLEAATDRVATVVEREPLLVRVTFENAGERVVLSIDKAGRISVVSAVD